MPMPSSVVETHLGSVTLKISPYLFVFQVCFVGKRNLWPAQFVEVI